MEPLTTASCWLHQTQGIHPCQGPEFAGTCTHSTILWITHSLNAWHHLQIPLGAVFVGSDTAGWTGLWQDEEDHSNFTAIIPHGINFGGCPSPSYAIANQTCCADLEWSLSPEAREVEFRLLFKLCSQRGMPAQILCQV